MPEDPDRHDTDPLADTQAPSDDGTDSPSTVDSGSRYTTKKRSVQAGDVLGRRYELFEDVGEGGMATVYRAKDSELRREVAVKVLFPHLARREEVVRRFQREARAAAGLAHPNILGVFDVGRAEGDEPPYIVMELIRGRSLLAEVEQRGPMLAEIVACIGALMADALGCAHKAGIVHRDVKPANVMIAPGGRLLLADFGVARLETEDSLVTKTGALLGTPAYMSPEQASGDTATAKSDLYSLGATMYQLATGSLPYSGSPAKVMAQIAQGSLVSAVRRRAAVGPDLSRVIDRLMATEAAARPANAAEVAAELRAIASAGGLGDANDELAAYFENPETFVAAKVPTIVTALVTSAERAIKDEKLPRAMALADRASALAPEDPSVTALIQTVTEGGRSSKRRRVAAMVGLGLVVAGGATFGATQLFSGESRVVAASDGDAIAMTADANDPKDTDVVASTAIDGGPIATMTPDGAAQAMIVDAGVGVRVRVDGGSKRDGGSLAIRIDGGVAVDAQQAIATVTPDAAVASTVGYIIVKNNVWCEVKVDDVAHGRPGKRIRVEAGQHTVLCEQPGTGNSWTRKVDIAAGETETVEGSLLGTVKVTFAVDATLDGVFYNQGTTRELPAARYGLVVGGKKVHIDIRRPCTVRATPDPGCY